MSPRQNGNSLWLIPKYMQLASLVPSAFLTRNLICLSSLTGMMSSMTAFLRMNSGTGFPSPNGSSIKSSAALPTVISSNLSSQSMFNG